MKEKYLIISFLLVASIVVAQTNFEGAITYNFNLHDKLGEMNDDEAAEFMGTQQTYYIKGSRYKTVTNGVLKVKQYYTGKDTLYTQMQGIKALLYTDVSKNKEVIISATIAENEQKVLDYSCKVLDIKTSDGSILYYYTKAIKVNPEDYKNHQYGFWYYCLQKTGGALPLKMVTNGKDMKLSIEATAIQKKQLSSLLFQIPKGLPIVKNPEN